MPPFHHTHHLPSFWQNINLDVFDNVSENPKHGAHDDEDDNNDDYDDDSGIFPKISIPGKVDPYVRVFLMPGTHNELKTKVKFLAQNFTFLDKKILLNFFGPHLLQVMKNNLNPIFNDEFSFVVSLPC